MQGRFYDGVDAGSHAARASFDGRAVTIEANGQTHVWPARELSVDIHGGEARISRRRADARLVVSESDWRAVAGLSGAVRSHSAAGGRGLVIGLVAAAAAVALFVFVGVPLASGPLARATPSAYEARLGESYNAQVSAIFPACEDEAGQAVLDQLGQRIAAESGSVFDIQFRAVHAPMVNAFALPGGYVLVTDDLIAEAETPDELAAVLAHETAHIAQRHSMQAVWRSLGAGMLLDLIVGGGSGAGQQAVLLAGQASELSFGREAETEADAFGRDYLHAAGLSSRGMAPFFERMAAQEVDAPEEVDQMSEWWMTHPNTGRRIEAARAGERDGEPALGAADWRTLQGVCGSGQGPDGRRPWFERLPGPRPGNDPLPGKPDQVGQD